METEKLLLWNVRQDLEDLASDDDPIYVYGRVSGGSLQRAWAFPLMSQVTAVHFNQFPDKETTVSDLMNLFGDRFDVSGFRIGYYSGAGEYIRMGTFKGMIRDRKSMACNREVGVETDNSLADIARNLI